MTNTGKNFVKIINLNYNSNNNKEEIINCFNIEGSEYKGILFNNKFIDEIINDNSIEIEEIKEKDYLNGILFYKDNCLICRMNQLFIGDMNCFIKKMININDNQIINDKNIFKKNEYIEFPENGYELQFNNMEIKDQVLLGFIYNKIK